MESAAADTPCTAALDKQVKVMKLSGAVLVTVVPVPDNILGLKQAIFEMTSIPVALQNLLEVDGSVAQDDGIELDVTQHHSMLLVTTETPMHSWDIKPNFYDLQLEGTSVLTCPRLQTDFCTVLTKEPIRSGQHYFEFVMHRIEDEQWCGITSDPNFAGPRANPRMARNCWTYYCGRRNCSRENLRDGRGALHAPGHAVAEFKQLRSEGDIIGMLIDMDAAALAFDLNGELQGACPIQTDRPLYCLTQVDGPGDKVELRKPSLRDAPPANLKALSGALLDITQDGKPAPKVVAQPDKCGSLVA